MTNYYTYLSGLFRRHLLRFDGMLRIAVDKILPKNLTYRYIIALSTVAALAVAGQIIIQTSLARQTHDQEKIRALENQIRESQSLRKSVLTLQLSFRKADIKNNLEMIESHSKQMKKNDESLFHRTKISFPIELLPWIQQAETNLSYLFEDCQNIKNLEIYEVNPFVSRPEYRLGPAALKLLTHEAAYRAALKEISKYHEHRLETQVKDFKRTEVVLLFSTLVVLVLEALYIFRPGVERVYEALKIRSDFLGRMGHEMRNPMNSILGMANLLSETPLTDQQKQYLSILRKSSSGLLEMLNNLLDFSSIESGAIKTEKIQFNLYKVLEKCIDLAVYGAHANGVELILNLNTNVPLMLQGDPVRLQQVLTNLLGNAVKFTKKGEVILKVSLQKATDTDAWIQFSVVDTGIGIDRKKVSRIFDAFVQEDSTVRRHFGGTGLGLSISRDLVELMGGTLSVESEKSVGSNFFFSIPFQVTENFSVDLVMKTEKLGSYQALLIEPNQSICNILTDSIQKTGGTPVLANHQSDFDALIKDCPVVLLDYEYVKSTLPSILSHVRKGIFSPERFIFVIKTTASSGDIEKLAEYGVKNFLFKPVKPLQLIEAIEHGLQSNVTKTKLARMHEEKTDKELVHDQRPLRILAVDDSQDNQFLVKAYLKSLPYRITFADNGRLAVEKFKDSRFDIVLMDLQMPEMDGYSATEYIREWEKKEGLSQTPIIAVSAHDNESNSVRFRKAHFSGYLVKPVAPNQLRKAILHLTKHIALAKTAQQPVSVSQKDAIAELEKQLAELAPKYLEKRQTELHDLKKYLQNLEFDKIQTIGHRLRGNAKSYGFEELGKIGTELEIAAREKNQATLEDLLNRLESFLNRSESSPKQVNVTW